MFPLGRVPHRVAVHAADANDPREGPAAERAQAALLPEAQRASEARGRVAAVEQDRVAWQVKANDTISVLLRGVLR